MHTRLLFHGVLVLFLLLSFVPTGQAQETSPDPVLELMAQMSAEAKVGQLVLVAFPGTDVGDDSEIAALIREYGIGGVLLRPQNGNFGEALIAPTEVVSITNHLQQIVWDVSQTEPLVLPGEMEVDNPPSYIPLFVAVSASLDGVPVTNFISDMTFMPSPMALGATWNPSLVEMAGSVFGEELAALGINLFLGPNLDVSYTPRPGDVSDLGVSTFGGDPFWVGEMGKAYVQGLHRGSAGRLLVVPRHLPGLGGADRSLEDEVPTVQKTLEQLRQIELAPFFAVARDVIGDDSVADGFLVTHIRYRGFQGNIRQATRPISLDAQALQSVMNLSEFAPWRQGGGVLVSDNLGLKSIHYSYDPRGLSFNARRVAQDALIAGNDLLVLNRFAADSGDWSAHFTNVRDTLNYLASRYKTETTFRTIVDGAVYRLLSMKMRAYQSDFSWEVVQLDPEGLGVFDTEHATVDDEVAINALTRIAPLSGDVSVPAFQEGDSIVIFTQERYAQPYAEYQPFPLLPGNALREAVLRLYGPTGTDIISAGAVQFFTFQQLHTALAAEQLLTLTEGPPSISTVILNAVKDARWVVFATTGLQSSAPNSYALKTFLSKYAHTVTGNIVVFAFGPPYELDSTEISKLDFFYALYSPGSAFVDAGARALFGDLVASGASPVDISALNYSIARQTMPSPDQLISLDVVGVTGEVLTETERSEILKGGVLNLRTDVIVDHNRRPIPDGTPVQFVLAYPQEDIERVVIAETHGGVATTSIVLDREGQLDITAHSEPALSSVRLQLTIRAEGPIEITAIEPTPTPTPTSTPPPPPTPTPTPTPVPERTQQLPDPLSLPMLQGAALLRGGIGGALFVALVGLLWARQRKLGILIAVRVALVGLIGGLFGYVIAIALGRFWLSGWLYSIVGREYMAVAVAVLVGVVALVPVMLSYLLQRRRRQYVEEEG